MYSLNIQVRKYLRYKILKHGWDERLDTGRPITGLWIHSTGVLKLWYESESSGNLTKNIEACPLPQNHLPWKSVSEQILDMEL